MMDADTNDNQQSADENAENIEELRVEDASADVDFDQMLDSTNEPTGSEPTGDSTVGKASPEGDISFEEAFSAEAEARVALQQQIESLQTQLEERNGQFARLTADFDNFRKRTVKERETLEEQVKCNTISGLLEVVDNFERARSQIKPQGEGELSIHKSYQGVYKQLVEALKKLGVSPMRCEGKEFDPNLHEAVMREPTNDYPEGTVIEEFVRGYVLGERVLRHAMVKVAMPLDSTAESG
ncbi:co-chaperone GrpE, putative [Synechococcus sp. PCC 7335]|nr:co-chaperone GrpE, putative [Synechococcus sp. PCC 7335]